MDGRGGLGDGVATEKQFDLTAAPLTVTPVLRLASGQEIGLDPVTIPSNASVSVWVNEALPKHSAGLLGQPGSYGSVVFRFTSPNARNLYAAVLLSLYGMPMGFRTNAYPAAGSEAWPRAAMAGSREGIWWQSRRVQNDVLILSNSSEKTLAGTLWLSDAAGKRWSQRLSLVAHQTRRLNVRELVGAAGLSGQYGGIQFEVPAHAGALDSIHFMYDETARLSALLEMFSRDPGATLQERIGPGSRAWTLWAPMLALRSPDPAVGLPARTVLQPTIFVRNTTAKQVSASITLLWRGESGKGQAKLPELDLAPFATQQLRIGAMQEQLGIPDDAHWALVTLTSSALPDDLIAMASSYDRTGRYNLGTRFSGNLGGSFVGGEWRADATHNMLAAVTNGGERATEALLTLHYADGKKKYEIQQTIPAGDQMWVNFADLIHNRVPDRKGNVLPADLISATYDLQDLDPGPGSLLPANLALDNTWGSQSGPDLPTCCGEYDPGWNPSFAPVPIDGELYINILAPDCHGVEQDVTNEFTTWSSDDSSIALVPPRKVQGVSSGNTTGWAYGEILEGSGTNCAWCKVQASAPIYVVSVQVTGADIESNDVDVTLSGQSNVSGTLEVIAVGTNNQPEVTYNGGAAVGPGSYHVAFNRPTWPADTYTSVKAIWNYNPIPATATLNLSRKWIVLGTIRHSQYNTVYESTCSTATQTAYLYDSSCTWQTVTLRSKYVSQNELNGTGVSQAYGILKYDSGKLCNSNRPQGSNTSNSLMKVSSITGQCNKVLVGGDSVATNPGPYYSNPYACDDNMELVDNSNQNKYLKHVEDQCANTTSGCADGHVDDYSSAQGCTGRDVGDLPGSPYWTVDDQ